MMVGLLCFTVKCQDGVWYVGLGPAPGGRVGYLRRPGCMPLLVPVRRSRSSLAGQAMRGIAGDCEALSSQHHVMLTF